MHVVKDNEVVDTTYEEVTKEEVTPEVASKITQEINQPTTFSMGDFTLRCFQCNNDEVLQPNIRGGLRFDMYTTDQHKITLSCKHCGAKMELFYKESAPLVEELITEENEPVLEISQVEE